MKVDAERIHKTQMALSVEVEKEQVDEALEKAYRIVVKKVNVPGFRKGKVPRPILEARFGPQVLYEDALEIMISKTFPDALKQAGADPLGEPKFEVVQLEKGQPLVYKATFAVKPEIQLPEYQGIEVEAAEPPPVTEEDVERVLQQYQQRMARLVEVKGPAQEGDILQIDFTGYLGEEPFPGGSATDYSLEIGSRTFIPGFEEQLIGAEVEEEREVNTSFPENYHNSELAGKEARFKVKVKGIRRKEVDAIDDEFAKDVSEFETLEELKSDISNKMKEQREAQHRQELKEKLAEKLLERVEVEAPEPMVKERLQEMVNQLSQTLSFQGLSVEKYLEMSGKQPQDLVNDMLPAAEKWVKQVLIIEAIAQQEGLAVSDQELAAEAEKFGKMYELSQEKVEKSLNQIGERLRRDLLIEKTLNFLLEHARIVPPAEAGEVKSESEEKA